MARTITGTLYKRGNTYWLKYVVNGQRVQKSLDTGNLRTAKALRQAEIAPLALAGEVDKAKALATRAGGLETELAAVTEATRPRLLLSEAWRKYVAARNRPQSGPLTLADYEHHWTRFAAWMHERRPGVETLSVEDVTPADCEAFMTQLETLGLGPNTFNKYRSTLKLIYRILAPYTGGKGNPFDSITPKGLDPVHHRELSEAELQTICSTATGELRTLFAIGLFTGFRLADATQLQWNEVDLRAGVIVRVPSKTRRKHKAVAVPIHRDLRTILEETPSAVRSGPVLPELCACYKSDRGQKVSNIIRNHFDACGVADVNTRQKAAARKKAGDTQRRTATASFHSLRHTLVSRLARSGVPLAVVRELVGHSSEAIQRVYLHTTREDLQKAIGALPAMGQAPGTEAPAEPDRATLLIELAELVKGAGTDTLKRMIATGKQGEVTT